MAGSFGRTRRKDRAKDRKRCSRGMAWRFLISAGGQARRDGSKPDKAWEERRAAQVHKKIRNAIWVDHPRYAIAIEPNHVRKALRQIAGVGLQVG